MKTKFLSQSYPKIIAASFLSLILIGTILLMMPFASKSGHCCGFLTALFTSTSATCVTGLVVADTYTQWTLFGQLVILLLIQIGGLGFITIATLFSIILHKKIGLKHRGLLQESINTIKIGGIVKLVKHILLLTLFFECVGAIILSIRFTQYYNLPTSIYYGIFHSISAFCNAGFDLNGILGQGTSFIHFVHDPIISITLSSLIVIGGLGFLVWEDILKNREHLHKYRLQSKIVIATTFWLIVGGVILYWVFERNGVLTGFTPFDQFTASLFGAITPRTAGFNVVDTASLANSTKVLTMLLMFIGGSSGSTAGGIKTTTFAVIAIELWSALTNKSCKNIFGRSLEDNVLQRATSVIAINLSMAIVAIIIICGLEPAISIGDISFEVFSAIGTVGMSTGITSVISPVSRFVIILLMFCGRVGGYSFAMAFTDRRMQDPIVLPKERITIG